MVKITALFVLSALSCLTSAVPLLEKRIAQVIADSKTAWEQACDKAGGGSPCNTIAVNAASTLLAAGAACDQQNAADTMIDLAKQLNSDPEMIRLAQLFVQQPRNAPDSLQVPYCQQAPKNAELNGLFHCQFQGSKFPNFSGDQTGNVPLGLTAVNPPGSCPAHTSGPIPDGQQLNSIVQDPGLGNVAGGANSGGDAAPANDTSGGSGAPDGVNNGASGGASDGVPANVGNGANGGTVGNTTVTDASSVVAAPAPAGTASAGASGGSSSFLLKNGQDAKALNAQFAGLTADSPCTDGEDACVGTAFAQCVGGKFVTNSCGSGLTCAAVPLVNKAGTSITCTTAADRDARIAATGA